MFGVDRPGGEPAEGAGDGGSGARDRATESPGHPNGADSEAHPNGADSPAHPNGAESQVHPNGAESQAHPNGSGSGAGNDGRDSTAAEPRRKPSRRAIAIGVAAVCVAGAGAGYGLSQLGGKSPSTPSSAPVSNGPIRVTSVTPSAGATRVNGANAVTVTFSQPVSANAAHPVLHPNVPGKWTAQGNTLVFTPTTAFPPSNRETMTIPAGANGVHSAGGRALSKSMTEHFTTGTYNQARLAELLAQLGYLPLNFSPQASGVGRIPVPESYQQNTSPQALAYDPPSGAYTWTQPYPSTLTSLWSPDSPNVVLKGAVMAFQSQHGMTINGAVTPRLWTAVFKADLAKQHNKNGYTYAVANKGSPETLTVYHDGQQVLRSLANTGIPVSPTVDGTFPVFLRLKFQIMQGTNPGGGAYADPVWWVSYFNGGDAVHYFPRGSYGFQQSLGCVELPWNDAKAAYPYLTYGSLVTVDG